jgi:hypothetical protein
MTTTKPTIAPVHRAFSPSCALFIRISRVERMVVKGTQNGQPFTVYFRGGLRISQPISPPLVVPGNQVLTVKIDPSAWFKNGNQILDLLSLNGQLVEFGKGMSSGLKSAERGDDD